MSETVHGLYSEKNREESARNSDLAEIHRLRLSNRLLADIFEDSQSEDERLAIYGKFMVIKHLGLGVSDEKLKVLCTTGLRGLNFEKSIVRQAHQIYNTAESFTAGDIELTAAYLGVFDYIWPDNGRMAEGVAEGADS